ncbi:hypothetical protein D0T84_00795 [Dysgonomonas sp. 521]|uniref:hypothetical protein n=1 Tax=Dysgonomonas sp. 521 TaxID=2302932 RepID=UPI0013D4F57B|nr:hypothetical protein [Dysgonomonas sp. 521]NDV93455.1 hypothetical protein [Dysgonomonas sp. 521]
MSELANKEDLINSKLSEILNGYNIVNEKGYVLRSIQFSLIYPRLAKRIVQRLYPKCKEFQIEKKDIKDVLGRKFNVIETSILRNLPTMVIKYFSTRHMFGNGVEEIYEVMSLATKANTVIVDVNGDAECIDVVSYVYFGNIIPIEEAKCIINKRGLSVVEKNDSGTVFDKFSKKSFKYFVKETKAKELD